MLLKGRAVMSGCVQGQQVGLGVEEVLGGRVPLEHIVLAEQQVKVLQCLGQEETLHHVPRPSLLGVQHAPDRRVPPAWHLAMPLKALEDPPAPISVSLVARKIVHVPEALQGFRSKKVVRVVALNEDVTGTLRFHVEMGNLG